MRIAIVGAGMAGLTCAEALLAAGHVARLFDKGRGPGGRMSTRRVPMPAGDAAFDHGAQYFTVRDNAFRARVARWSEQGHVARWPAAGEDAWVGVPGMSAPIRAMAAGLDVRWSARVESLTRDAGIWRVLGAGIEEAGFDGAVIAVPAEQAAPLLQPWDAEMAGHAARTESQPCWTVMAAFSSRVSIEPDILRENGIIGWAARDSAKPGRSGPESWVIQAGPDWSRAHLEDDPSAVTRVLIHALSERAGAALPKPLTATAHRWRYARSGGAGIGMLWNPDFRLGACGDWLLGPRVECAWLSGTALAEKILRG